MTEIEIAWLAGLLEGEGNFEVVPARPHINRPIEVRVNLSMTDRDVVERVAKLVEATSSIRKQGRNNNKHKPIYILSIKGYRAIRVMSSILPFMMSRRSARIQHAIEAWNSVTHTRERHLPPTCHPERSHYAKGFCQSCYKKVTQERASELRRIRDKKNKDRLNERQREYYAANRDKMRSDQNRRREANKDDINRRRRERYALI